mmetsp:Transcript_18713/g.56105  ORF Transcript_18713/g.56105 Transcript_18713/m.56105 type:complete len:449 (-) Transcript_18713:127-1473(-)
MANQSDAGHSHVITHRRGSFSSTEYHDLPHVKLFVLPYSEDVVDELCTGPADAFSKGIQVTTNKDNIFSAGACFTYPHLPNKENREGDPIADTFSIQLQSNHTVIASVADGCNWGTKPLEAATLANRAFREYLNRKQCDTSDVSEAGHFLLRAFENAHKRIISGKESVWDAGTTTLFGAMLLPVDTSTVGVLDVDSETPPPFGFVCASVGDCKGFYYSKAEKRVLDITAGNRFNINDATDPGGRLGPFIPPDGQPDLRNLHLFFIPCHPGDMFIIASDGVYDNLDPQHLGLSPRECDPSLEFDDWSAMSREAEEDAKVLYVERNLEARLGKLKECTSEAVTRCILDHVIQVTLPGREWLMANPRKRLPKNYREYPGKMDHATCLTITVPEPVPVEDSSSSERGSAKRQSESDDSDHELEVVVAAAAPASSSSSASSSKSRSSKKKSSK